MKDYKRLTDRVIAEMLRNTEEESWDSDNIEAQCYIRLADLEDKIESGEIDYVADRDKQIACLTAENAELRVTLSKMETVEKELRARLDKAVELPAKVMIERTIVNGKFKPTQKAQAFNGRIGVVYRDKVKWNGLLVDICSEKVYDDEAAEARLKEIKEKNSD